MAESTAFVSWESAVQWLRSQPERQELVRDAYFDDPLMDAAERYRASEEWCAIRRLIPEGAATALDVGAGRGIASYAMARDGLHVTALEPDPSEIVGAGAIRSLARDAGLTIDVREDFSERLPFADACFDLVFARAVLHHTRDLGAACREFFRVLRPGGVLIAVREHVISRPADLPDFLERHPLHRLYGGEHAYLLSAYRGAMIAAGLVIERTITPLGSPINHAPRTERQIRLEIADHLAAGLAGVRAVARATLAIPGVWWLACRIIARFDHRPGRLYSFVARRR